MISLLAKGDGTPTRAGWAVLVILTVAAFGLRVWGADQSAPYVPDTQVIREAMDVGQQLATGSAPFDVGVGDAAKYPLVLPYLLLVVYGAIFAGGRLFGVFQSLQDFTGWLFLNRVAIHVLTVCVISLISALSVPLAFFTARRFEGRRAPWLAAILIAFSLLLIHFSHHARPHIPLAFFVLLTLYCSLRVYESGTLRDYILAALSVALAGGTLQNGLLTIIPFGVAHLLRSDWRSPRGLWQALINRRLLVSLVVMAFSLLAAYPQLIFQPQVVATFVTTGSGRTILVLGGQHRLSIRFFSLMNVPENFGYLFGYEPIVTLFGLFGLAYYLFRAEHRAEHIILTSFVIVFGVVFGLLNFSLPHYFAPLVAILAIMAARVLIDLYGFISLKIPSAAWAFGLGAGGIVIIGMAVLALRLDYVLGQADTRTQARDWILANLLPGTAIASDFRLELFPTQASIQRQQTDYPGTLGTREQWLSQLPVAQYPSPVFALTDLDVYQIGTQADLAELVESHQIKYLAFEQYLAQPRTDSIVYDYALAQGTRVAVFCPDPKLDPRLYYALPNDISIPWMELWKVDFPGPIVQIFSLEPPLAEQPRLPLC